VGRHSNHDISECGDRRFGHQDSSSQCEYRKRYERRKTEGQNFFDAEHNQLITFHSTKIVQTGPDALDYVGDFTIRGVTKPEKLTFTLSGKGTA